MSPALNLWTAAHYEAVYREDQYTVARTVHFIDRHGEKDQVTEYLGEYGSDREAARADAERFNQAWKGRHANHGETKC